MKNVECVTFSEELLAKVAKIPTSPGIYQYKNEDEKIIYIGKAKNLRNRVRSYFQSNRTKDAKTQAMIGKIVDIEIIIVDSEAEALILEDTLIKKHKPRYNIMLRDDKTFPFIRITNEEFPRIFLTRNIIKDGSKYLGPYTDVRHIKFVLSAIRNIFQIRSCKLKLNVLSIGQGKFRSCLDLHIGKCQAPCINKILRLQYSDNVKMAYQALLGKTKKMTEELEQLMLNYSDKLEFENAGIIKKRLESLHNFTSKQKIVSTDLVDRDIFALSRKGDFACTLIFNIREGKLISKRHFLIAKSAIETDEVLLQKTIEKWYMEAEFVPSEIILQSELEEPEYILDWLGKKKNRVISMQIPKIGDKKKLIDMAKMNAEFILNDYLLSLEKRDQKIPHSIIALQRDLNLKTPLRRIECYDNSHIQGTDIVSSMVVFIDGKPKKSEYRKFKAQEVKGNDDFATMRETIFRRFRRAIEEKQELPELVIVDGGKGQLSSAYGILKDLGLDEKIVIIGLAKRLEEVFVPNKSDSILLPKTSSSLKLIQQLRDEAHRFAITFHRELRSKRMIKSEIFEIDGIGEATAKKLLTQFESLKGIKTASDENLLTILNRKQLSALKEYLLTHIATQL